MIWAVAGVGGGFVLVGGVGGVVVALVASKISVLSGVGSTSDNISIMTASVGCGTPDTESDGTVASTPDDVEMDPKEFTLLVSYRWLVSMVLIIGPAIGPAVCACWNR